MGVVINLAERLADRSRPRTGSATAFFFDLACPFSYLAAERVERTFGDVEWVPAPALEPCREVTPAVIAETERRAIELRLPLSWPEAPADGYRGALRAAAFATEQGRGSRFALAALRLAFSGGYDLGDDEILAAAAEAAGIPVDGCLEAATDGGRDAQLEATALGLYSRGVTALPAIRVDRRWFEGERAVAEASALLRARTAYERPLAPAS